MIRAPAKLYDLALGMGVGCVVQEALLPSQGCSDLIHMKECILWVLLFDIFHFLLLRFVSNSC